MTNLILSTTTACTCPLTGAGISNGFLVVISLLVIWSLIWKGIALWKSAQNRDKVWFVIMLIVNTVGILEIIYIFVFSQTKDRGQNLASSTSTPL
jgi:hypothetical protein